MMQQGQDSPNIPQTALGNEAEIAQLREAAESLVRPVHLR